MKERTFRVRFDPGRKCWIAQDDAGQLLGRSASKGVAIGCAVNEANRASLEGSCVIVMVTNEDGTERKEYVALPPAKR